MHFKSIQFLLMQCEGRIFDQYARLQVLVNNVLYPDGLLHWYICWFIRCGLR